VAQFLINHLQTTVHMNTATNVVKVRNRTGRSIHIHTDQILYIEGLSNYSRIYVDDSQPYLTSLTLKEQQAILPFFFRISRSYLVNPKRIRQFELRNIHNSWVEVDNEARLTVSRRKVKEVANLVAGYRKAE